MRLTSNEEIKKSLLKRAIGHNLLSLIAQIIALLVLIIMKNKGDVVVLIILTVFQYLLIVEIILIIIDSANLLYSYFCYKKGTPSIGKLLRFSKTRNKSNFQAIVKDNTSSKEYKAKIFSYDYYAVLRDFRDKDIPIIIYHSRVLVDYDELMNMYKDKFDLMKNGIDDRDI